MGGADAATSVSAPRLGTGPHLLCPSPDNPLHVESDSLEASAEKRGGPGEEKKGLPQQSSRFPPWV